MRIGVPKERLRDEHRVGLTRYGVSQLAQLGHEVYVEHDAGVDCHWTDLDYESAGGNIVYSTDEVYKRSDLICRIGTMDGADIDALSPGTTVCGFLHLAVMPREQLSRLVDRRMTLIGYEIIDNQGHRPILMALSEIAGHLAVHTAAHLLEYDSGGRGLLLGGVPAIPPPTVVVLGAGTAGVAAAKLSLAIGAHVIVMDSDVNRLRRALSDTGAHLTTAVPSERNLKRFSAIADVLIGAIATPGARSPFLITESMVKNMRPGSVVIDLSIDQGGCVETSRPTSLHDPTFRIHDVTHYCVPNMTASVPRTASRAATIAALPYLTSLAGRGVKPAMTADRGLACGLYMFQGKLVNENLAQLTGEAPARLDWLLT